MNDKIEKFFFDKNNFDEPKPSELEQPPEPVFTQAEMEEIRNAAFNKGFSEGEDKGRKEALEETSESIEKETMDKLSVLIEQANKLIAAENERFSMFEDETIKIIQSLYEQMFPKLKESYGFDEVQSFVHEVLVERNALSVLEVKTSEKHKEKLEEFIENFYKNKHQKPDVIVMSDSSMHEMDVTLSWPEGMAEKQSGAIEEAFKIILARILNKEKESDVKQAKKVEENEEKQIEEDVENSDDDKNQDPLVEESDKA